MCAIHQAGSLHLKVW